MTSTDATSSPTAPFLVGTSWKMNKSLSEAREYVDELVRRGVPPGVQAFLLPPLTALASVRRWLPEDSGIRLGAQNAHWEPEGSLTGEVSMRMVRDAGAEIVEVGHAERRAHFGETDEQVSLKVAAAVANDLTALVCVGDPSSAHDEGGTIDFVVSQVRAALGRLTPGAARDARVHFAYEPLWAIGPEGSAADPEQVTPVVTAIRDEVRRWSSGASRGTVLYGGNVTTRNAGALRAHTGIDGLFVGRFAWSVTDFCDLLETCSPEPHALQPLRAGGS